MDIQKELKTLAWIVVVFASIFFMPLGSERFLTAIDAILDLSQWYAREHVVLCLLPAFFIAGVIAVFVSQGSVIKYFGANAKKWLSYTVAAVSGGILAVCSCTILPLFTSIYKRGAGLGPAIAFLYSGPAISILSIILTARILGIEMGIARVVGAVSFSVIIGLAMSFIFRKEEKAKKEEQMNIVLPAEKRPVWQTAFHFFTLVLILVFANWGAPAASENWVWYHIFGYKWYITGGLGMLLCWSLVGILKLPVWKVLLAVVLTGMAAILANLFIANAKSVPLVPMIVAIAALSVILLTDTRNDVNREWALSSWGFAKQILPLLAMVWRWLVSCWVPRTMALPLPESFRAVGLSGRSGAIRFFPTSSPASSVHSCILPRLRKYRLFKVCWLREWAKVRHWPCCLQVLPCPCPTCSSSGACWEQKRQSFTWVLSL